MTTGPTLLVDITRTLSRADQGPATGVDRVERAYIRHGLSHDALFLARALGGFALLDAAGMIAFLRHMDGEAPWRKPDLLSHLGRRQTPMQRRAEATLRHHAIAVCPRTGLPRMLRAQMTPDFRYLNVGHSNQAGSTLSQIREGGAGRIAVMVHDVIPLDFPHLTRTDTPATFARRLQGAARQADLLICNSLDTQARLEGYLTAWNISSDTVVAYLGVEPAPAASRTPDQSFVVLGTIEPRKNHALLLDVWDQFDNGPTLHVIGRRGWENAAVFTRLDTGHAMGKTVFEHSDLTDAEVHGYLSKASALLFPTLAEGFGFPVLEALQAGVPVIASDLDVFHELAPEGPVYLDPRDTTAWRDAVLDHAAHPRRWAPRAVPRWEAHFDTLSTALAQPLHDLAAQ